MKYAPFQRELSVWFLAVGLLASCSKNDLQRIDENPGKNTIVVDLNDRKQTIRNFGASDAWACQYIGLWPNSKRAQVADWLFSTKNDSSGKPVDIGLSLWRFNIGAGSANQSNISDDWRRAEGFLQDDMSYDWTKQSGQKWFMHAASQRGVNQFLGFANSPPIQLTKNGKAYSSNGDEANIDLRDMILRNRNRTSVIMWSIGNEIDYPNDPYTHEILNTGKNPQEDTFFKILLTGSVAIVGGLTWFGVIFK